MTDEINEYRRDSKGVPLVAGLIFLVFLAAVASFFYGVRFVRHDPKLTIIEVNDVNNFGVDTFYINTTAGEHILELLIRGGPWDCISNGDNLTCQWRRSS